MTNVQPIRSPRTSVEEGKQDLIILLPVTVRFPGSPNFNARAYFPERSMHPEVNMHDVLPKKEASDAQTIGLLQMRTCSATDIHAREMLARAYSENTLSWGAIAYLQQQNPRGLPPVFWAQVQIGAAKVVVQVRGGQIKKHGHLQQIPHDGVFAVPIP